MSVRMKIRHLHVLSISVVLSMEGTDRNNDNTILYSTSDLLILIRITVIVNLKFLFQKRVNFI